MNLPPRARLQAGLAVLALALLGISARLAVVGGGPLYQVGKELLVGALFVIAGLAGWARRPDSRTGPLMAAAGLVWLLARVFIWSGTGSFVFTVGLILVVTPIALIAHMAVGFPGGRISSKLERAIVVSAYLVILAGVGFLDVGACPDCPANLLLVGPGGIGRWAETAIEVATLLSIAAFVATLARHWLRGTPATRRMLVPVLPTASLYAAISATFVLVELGLPLRPVKSWETVEYIAILAVPLAFLAGLLRSRLARADVGTLVVELGEGSGGELRGALAKALRDPTVEVAYWTDDPGGYRHADGQAMDLSLHGQDRTATVIERKGLRVGALVHDRALLDDPALLDSVCAAAGLALENQRLHAEVVARLEDVRTSRARIVEAGDAERQRVERNLHDGAQQRLVSLSMALRMARDRVGASGDPSLVGLLGDASEELNLALRELRELAAGLHPPILTDEGLEAALESLAERSAVPVELSLGAPGRLAAPVEVAAYYVVSEALANAAKHARASHAVVRTCRADHQLDVEVVDDGVGGAAARPGSGLEGLTDRVEALGGTLCVESRPGEGTRLVAHIPCG